MLKRQLTRMHPKHKAQLLLALCFIAGGVVGFNIHPNSPSRSGALGPVRIAHKEYKMIQPLLACDFPYDESNENLSKLKSQLENDILNAQKRGDIQSASVYLQTLNTGDSIGLNEHELFNPASMFKVVLMITYARVSETHPDLFEKKLTMTDVILREGVYGLYYATTSLEVGKSYRIGDLIDTMVTNSDNGAKDLLLANIATDELVRTIRDYGLEMSRSGADSLKMSPKDISLFFRTLYNATYLDNLHSEVALQLLSRTTFTDGLVKGIPYGTPIAHKYGEYVEAGENGEVKELELHDCGIVYVPGNPYFLCVMTRGNSHQDLSTIISTISQHAYYQLTNVKL